MTLHLLPVPGLDGNAEPVRKCRCEYNMRSLFSDRNGHIRSRCTLCRRVYFAVKGEIEMRRAAE